VEFGASNRRDRVVLFKRREGEVITDASMTCYSVRMVGVPHTSFCLAHGYSATLTWFLLESPDAAGSASLACRSVA
jgi:hypothetical protein